MARGERGGRKGQIDSNGGRAGRRCKERYARCRVRRSVVRWEDWTKVFRRGAAKRGVCSIGAKQKGVFFKRQARYEKVDEGVGGQKRRAQREMGAGRVLGERGSTAAARPWPRWENRRLSPGQRGSVNGKGVRRPTKSVRRRRSARAVPWRGAARPAAPPLSSSCAEWQPRGDARSRGASITARPAAPCAGTARWRRCA